MDEMDNSDDFDLWSDEKIKSFSTESIGSEAIDLLFGIRKKEDKRLAGVLEKDLAQVDLDDEKEEMLYKMYE